MENSKKTVVRPTLEEVNQYTEDKWRESNGFLVEVPCGQANNSSGATSSTATAPTLVRARITTHNMFDDSLEFVLLVQ